MGIQEFQYVRKNLTLLAKNGGFYKYLFFLDSRFRGNDTADEFFILGQPAMPKAKQLEDTVTRILSKRMHTQKELRRKLQQKGFSSAGIESAINHAASSGWLNDYEAAKQLTREQLRSGRHGRHWVEAKLRERGIQAEVIQTVLDELWDFQIECDLSAKALKGWLISHSAKKSANNQRAEAYKALLRRGFDPEISAQLCRELPEKSELYNVDIGSD